MVADIEAIKARLAGLTTAYPENWGHYVEVLKHAPGDIRALLDRVEELEDLAKRQHETLRTESGCYGMRCHECLDDPHPVDDGCKKYVLLMDGRKILEGK